MRAAASSREEILSKCKELVREKGAGALTVQAVASACSISVGCVYNYFPSKASLVLASIESIWGEILDLDAPDCPRDDFEGCVRWFFGRLGAGSARYPGFFAEHAHELRSAQAADGSDRMVAMLLSVRAWLENALEKDPRIRPRGTVDDLSYASVSEMVIRFALGAITAQDFGCDTLVAVLRRALC